MIPHVLSILFPELIMWFVRGKLCPKSDVVVRSYNLVDKERKPINLMHYIQMVRVRKSKQNMKNRSALYGKGKRKIQYFFCLFVCLFFFFFFFFFFSEIVN